MKHIKKFNESTEAVSFSQLAEDCANHYNAHLYGGSVNVIQMSENSFKIIFDEFTKPEEPKTLFTLTFKDNKVTVDPYQIIIEGEFTILSKFAVEFFDKAGKIYADNTPSPHRKGRTVHNWDEAKRQLEDLVIKYSSDNLNKVSKVGVFD